MQIQQLLERDLNRKIEEIIQVDQADERSVYEELTEYVVTERMRDQYAELLQALARGPADLDESVGVWISGFFGSGKSSFAKILGYVLANRRVCDHAAAELFKQQVASCDTDGRIAALVDSIIARMAYRVVLFDVQKDRGQSGQGNLSISPYMYRVLLRELGYADDFDIAELEIGLEAEGRLDEFIRRFDEEYACDKPINGWRKRGRSGAEVWNRIGVILHQMDARTYPTPESFARGLAQRRVEVTPRLLVERSFELMSRPGRGDGKALAFVMDEVGAYVSFSQDRLEDLRAVVELYGKESKNRIKAGRLAAPTWVIVTAQERLEEVTSALGDDKRVLLAKVQDRFQHRVDLSPADIREVATRRVLAKHASGATTLHHLFAENQGRLHVACQLERTNRWSELSADEFVRFYPYLPHYIELSIDIMSGLRLQGSTLRQLSGSNRTIISQVYQMLVNERTNYAERPLGALVTLDKLYELIEGLLGSARRKDIDDITERFKSLPEDQGWAARVGKVIALTEHVSALPRTAVNLAALLVDEVGQAAPLAEVQAAIARLMDEDFVRESDRGYKLQTAQEKTWAEERRRYLEPRPRDRREIQREMLAAIFGEPALKTYNYRGLRTFRVGVSIDGVRAHDDAQVPLSLLLADDEGQLASRIDDVRTASRDAERKHEIAWVFALDSMLDELVAQLHASRQMVAKYGALKAQQRITSEEATNLESERTNESHFKSRLQAALTDALRGGTGIFRGSLYDGSELGRTPSEIFKRLFDRCVPDLYPKLELGARPLKGNEAEEVLKAANLNALPQVFYSGEGGLGLIVQEGQKYVPSTNAAIAKEILDFLRREHSYGNRVTGKILSEHFQGVGYGWEIDILRLVLAVLLRAGAIEVTHQSQRFANHQKPQSRAPFTNVAAFKAASFSPRESIDLKTLIAAVRSYEDLTGDEVDVEESAIAEAFQKLASDELTALLPTVAEARANQTPGQEVLEEYREFLSNVQTAASDDCVRMLVGEGRTFKELRDRVRSMREALKPAGLETLRRGREALTIHWPEVEGRVSEPEQLHELRESATELAALRTSAEFYRHLDRMQRLAELLIESYQQIYRERHATRACAYRDAIASLTSREEWATLDAERREHLLRPFQVRQCHHDGHDGHTAEQLLPDGAERCIHCGATISQIESDTTAAESVLRQAISRLQELTLPTQRIERLRVATFFTRPLDSPEAIEAALRTLSEALHKLVAEGSVVVLE
ncbi:MAG: BREX system P-loop protein BrxC [Candidatus Viridilinea halotolerans]|uniref:BREX system P-loop protein BrxC n=1 Tax=Candidatus Viridilinea halotolerans TaxID=2491704 RepID=A0A426U335_9CHLR|nr:MAG: BREX system P-loop protein BrxC [Candidatus Viridilinea halotolerans]